MPIKEGELCKLKNKFFYRRLLTGGIAINRTRLKLYTTTALAVGSEMQDGSVQFYTKDEKVAKELSDLGFSVVLN